MRVAASPPSPPSSLSSYRALLRDQLEPLVASRAASLRASEAACDEWLALSRQLRTKAVRRAAQARRQRQRLVACAHILAPSGGERRNRRLSDGGSLCRRRRLGGGGREAPA